MKKNKNYFLNVDKEGLNYILSVLSFRGYEIRTEEVPRNRVIETLIFASRGQDRRRDRVEKGLAAEQVKPKEATEIDIEQAIKDIEIKSEFCPRYKKIKKRQLSSREKEVLRYVCDGFTNKEIAAELIISIGTVNNHLCSLLDKTETKNRAALVAWAYSNFQNNEAQS